MTAIRATSRALLALVAAVTVLALVMLATLTATGSNNAGSTWHVKAGSTWHKLAAGSTWH